MPTLAYFGIESSGLNLVIDLLILFVVVLYLSLIYWTYADARRRIVDPMLIGCATAASLFPFVGTIVYLILRPPEYLEDVRERELETRAAEARLHDAEHRQCPHCDYPIERDFLRCPSCLRKLKEGCTNCSRPLDPAWTICPYCEADVAAAPSARRISQRRAAGSGAADGERPKLRASTPPAPSSAAARASERMRERDSDRGAANKRAAKPAAASEEDVEVPASMAASEASRGSRSGRAAPRSGRPRPSA